MEQNVLVRNLCGILQKNTRHDSLTVGYDLTNNGQPGESRKGPLYWGEKARNRGRTNQIAQPDILVCREVIRTVALIGEVEVRKKKPKDFYALFCSAVFADNHTPSNKYGLKHQYRFSNTCIVVVTLQCKETAEMVAESIKQKVNLTALGISGLFVCGGTGDGQAEAEFEMLIRTRLTSF